MNKLTIYKITKNTWILIIIFATAMGGLGAYLNEIAVFGTSRLYQNIFILSLGLGEILLILIGAILMVRMHTIVVRRSTE